MTVLEYPVDDPEVVRAGARGWRAARATLGESGSAVASQASTTSGSWQGVASRAAVGQLERNGARLGEAASALEEAASLLDRYANALDDARGDIDRLNADLAGAEARYRRDLDVVDGRQAGEGLQASTSEIRGRYRVVLGLLYTTASLLGDRLLEIAAGARPGWVDRDAGPAAVVRQNAGDSGYVDWVTHLALTHPNLDAEQRLWTLEHRERFEEQFDFLLSSASNPAVTEETARNYADQMADRNSRHHLAESFATNHLEFVDALLLPMVVATITSVGFRQAQYDSQLVAAVLDAATPGMLPAQFTPSSTVARPQVPLGFLGRRGYAAFTRELNAGLRRAGYDDAAVYMRGSSVTGARFSDGAPPPPSSEPKGSASRSAVGEPAPGRSRGANSGRSV